MALPPNMAYGTNNDPAGERKRARRQQRRAARQAERAETRAKGGKPGKSKKPSKPKKPSAPAPAAPQYGPYRQRAESEANLRYGPLQRELGQELTNVSGTPTQPGWFDQYKAAAAQAGQQIANRYQAAQTQMQNQQLVGPAGGTNPELAQAMAAQGAVNQAFSNLLTTASTADQNYMTNRGTVADAAKLSAQMDNQKARQDLASDRGEYVVVRKGELKDQAHTQRLENKVFGLNVAKAQAEVQGDRQERRQERREKRQERRDELRDQRRENRQANREVIPNGAFAGFTKAQVRKMSPAEKQKLRDAAKSKSSTGGTDSKPRFTPLQQRDGRKDFRKVFRDVRRNDNGLRTYGQTIKNTLIDADADPLLVRAAVQLYMRGRVSGSVAQALFRDYGIKVKPRAPHKRPAPSTMPDTPGSDAAQG